MKKKIIAAFKKLDENTAIVIKNIIGAFIVKGFALILSFATIPAYMRFFKNQPILGLWYTILSVLNWVLYFDLGIGNGLRNHLTVSITENNEEESKRLLSSAYVSTALISIGAIIVFCVLSNIVNWTSIFGIERDFVDYSSLKLAVDICFLGIILQLFLRNISSVLYAFQKSSVNNLLSLCTSLIIYLFVKILPSGSNESNLINMALVHSFAVILPLLITTLFLFSAKLKSIRPSISYSDFKHTKSVLGLGISFSLAQLTYMLIMSTNELQITHMTNSGAVVEYQAYYRLFSLGSTIFTLALTPVWSAITKAKTEGDYGWIRKLYQISILVTLGISILEFILAFISKPVMSIWLGDQMIDNVSLGTSLNFAIFGSLMMLNGALSCIANGLGDLKRQIICYIIGAVIRIPLSLLFVGLLNKWDGVLISNSFSLLIYCVFEIIHFHHLFKRKVMNTRV